MYNNFERQTNYDFCERPAGKRTNGRMSVRRLKQNILSIIMIFANDLWLFIGRFKATLSHPIWIEHLAKRVIFCLFLRFATPPPFTEGMVEVCSREAAAFKNCLLPPMLLFNSIFFTTYCKEYQLFTHNTQPTNCIIIANVKTLDRFYCKERERYLRTFPLLFRLGNSNSLYPPQRS